MATSERNPQRFEFEVGRSDGGTHIAISQSEPFFCLTAVSEEAAIDSARRALAAYGRYRTRRTDQVTTHRQEVTITTFRGRKVHLEGAAA